MRNIFGICAAIVLAGCMSTEQAQQQSYVGQQNGQRVYQFTTETGGLWAQKKLDSAVRNQARRICPGGYREMSRVPIGNVQRVINGVPAVYSRYQVTIGC